MRIEKIGDTSIDCGGGKLLELKRESVEGMCNFVTEDIHLPTWEVTSALALSIMLLCRFQVQFPFKFREGIYNQIYELI